MDEKKFKTLLMLHDYAAAEDLLANSDLTEARRQELSRLITEHKRRFWRNFFEKDLYAGIPAVVMFLQLLLWAFSIISRRLLEMWVLSTAVSAGMIWFYQKTVRPLWKQLKRPGGMSVFERDQKRLGILLWRFGLVWSLLFTAGLPYMAAMSQVPPR